MSYRVNPGTGLLQFVAQSGQGTTDYNKLSNLPSINNVTLKGNKTGKQLSIVDAQDYITQQFGQQLNRKINELLDSLTTNKG